MLKCQVLAVELAPPHNHGENVTERSNHRCKNNLIAGISGANPYFLMTLWDSLISQANIAINLIRNSRINPKLSACTQIVGQLDYDRKKLSLPCCKRIVHETTAKIKTWAVHGTKSYYTSPTLQYCR